MIRGIFEAGAVVVAVFLTAAIFVAGLVIWLIKTFGKKAIDE